MKRKTSQLRTILRRVNSSEHTTMAVLALVVGVAGGYGAVGFRYLIDFFQTAAYGSPKDLLHIVHLSPWWLRLLIPTAGGFVVGLLIFLWAREAKGHGVPEVMEAVALRGGVIRKRLVVIKSLASAICIATGGSVGREGPIVQIGSAIGSTIGQLVKISADRMRTMVGCGAAAGIAATFNAPIAGVMFALEVILGDFAVTTFSPIVISAVTATAISRHYLGDIPAFAVPSYELVSAWEFPLYGVLGVVCAGVGVLFVVGLYRLEDFFDRFQIQGYIKAAIGGFIIGAMALLFPHIMGVGYGAIDKALIPDMAWWVMLILIFYKVLATGITIGSGGSGGIFAPSLFLGAMTGGLFGTLVHSGLPGITASPGAYGIVGMGALVSATTHGPMTAILMLFEMTGDYKIILPLMATCIIASAGANLLLRDSIYTLKLARRGTDLKAGKEVNILKSIPVHEIMNTRIESVRDNIRLSELTDHISKSKYNSFPVIDAQRRLVGMLSFADYHEVLFDENLGDLIIARDLASLDAITVTSEDNLYDALQEISQQDFALLPVVAGPDDPELVGIVTRRDIVGAYDKAVVKQALFVEKTTDNVSSPTQ